MAYVKLGSKAEGSIIKLKENGVLVDFYVAKQNYESGLNGAGRVLVVRKDCYDMRQWNGTNVNEYTTSDIDAWLKGPYKRMLDPDIQTAMGTTKIYYAPSNAGYTKTISRSVFLLSAAELGYSGSLVNAEGTALSATVLNLLRIAHLNGSAVVQWTRSPNALGSENAWCLGNNGYPYDYSCSGTYGSRPAFTLPSSLLVSDDGSISTNTSPTYTKNTLGSIPCLL